MAKYTIFNADNTVANIIIWDGVTPLGLKEGLRVEPFLPEHSEAFRPKPIIPPVSRAQGRLALYKAGLLAQAEAILSQSSIETKIWYEDAQFWERDHPVVVTMGQALGLTPEQIDQMFLSA